MSSAEDHLNNRPRVDIDAIAKRMLEAHRAKQGTPKENDLLSEIESQADAWIQKELARLRQENQKLRMALHCLLDNVDYTQQNCRPNEMVGAVLPRSVIENARTVLKTPMPAHLEKTP